MNYLVITLMRKAMRWPVANFCQICGREKALIASPLFPPDSCFRGLTEHGTAECDKRAVDWVNRCYKAEEMVRELDLTLDRVMKAQENNVKQLEHWNNALTASEEVCEIRNKILNFWASKLGYPCTNEFCYPALVPEKGREAPVLVALQEHAEKAEERLATIEQLAETDQQPLCFRDGKWHAFGAGWRTSLNEVLDAAKEHIEKE